MFGTIPTYKEFQLHNLWLHSHQIHLKYSLLHTLYRCIGLKSARTHMDRYSRTDLVLESRSHQLQTFMMILPHLLEKMYLHPLSLDLSLSTYIQCSKSLDQPSLDEPDCVNLCSSILPSLIFNFNCCFICIFYEEHVRRVKEGSETPAL